jgi:predicted O-methyltransferase YrrM
MTRWFAGQRPRAGRTSVADLPEPAWVDADRFTIDGVDFTSSFEPSRSATDFCVRKPRALIERTLAHLSEHRPRRIVELGIASGGGTALLALAARPELLLALEIDTDRVVALDELIVARALGAEVRTHYGVDQSDAGRIGTLVAEVFGARPIDLVVDDASHRFAESRASFEILFPRLRTGGHYVIEDWNWQLRLAHSIAAAGQPAAASDRRPSGQPAGGDADLQRRVSEYVRANWSTPPLERLALELVLARACSRDLIGTIRIEAEQVIVERGSAPIDAATFRLTDYYTAAADVLG